MTDYTPFKMKATAFGNSPMKKNFGVGTKEQPNDDAMSAQSTPGKLRSPAHKGITGGGGGGGGGFFGKIREKIAAMKAKKEAGQAMGQAPQGGVEQAPEAMAAAAGGEGGVEQHGPEAHTGGAGPQGGMKKKNRLFQSMMGGGNVGNLFSDIRLKENIERTGISKSGIPTYEFNYIGGTNRYSGAMAQDLLAMNSDAVSLDVSGYYKVNYNDIDVDMHLIN